MAAPWALCGRIMYFYNFLKLPTKEFRSCCRMTFCTFEPKYMSLNLSFPVRQSYNIFKYKVNIELPNLSTQYVQSKRYSSDIKIYTKTGDEGLSSLYTGERRPKSDISFNILGNIDELSSFIGLAKENALENSHDYVEQLERIQCILQDIGTLVATPVHVKSIKDEERKEKVEKRIRFSKRHIMELEVWIDQHSEELPPLTNFILPGGGRISASLHVCRTVCRRLERSIVPLVTEDIVDPNVLVYINRLSDYLFTVARCATILDGKKETIYIRPKPSKKLGDTYVEKEKPQTEKG